MMNKKPDFASMAFRDRSEDRAAGKAAWKAQIEKETGKSLEELISHTVEQIDVAPIYTAEDLKGMNHLDFMAGVPPFLRGPYPTMYVTRPWTVRQYAGFSTAEESNAFYRRNLAAGQKGLSIAFDLAPTAAMTPITPVWWATWARPAWPLTPSWIWRSSSPASRWTRCPCP